jgi:hypothetical protein
MLSQASFLTNRVERPCHRNFKTCLVREPREAALLRDIILARQMPEIKYALRTALHSRIYRKQRVEMHRVMSASVAGQMVRMCPKSVTRPCQKKITGGHISHDDPCPTRTRDRHRGGFIQRVSADREFLSRPLSQPSAFPSIGKCRSPHWHAHPGPPHCQWHWQRQNHCGTA